VMANNYNAMLKGKSNKITFIVLFHSCKVRSLVVMVVVYLLLTQK